MWVWFCTWPIIRVEAIKDVGLVLHLAKVELAAATRAASTVAAPEWCQASLAYSLGR